MVITYMQNAIVHVPGSSRVRLSLPKQLKGYLCQTYAICENYLYLENKVFQGTDVIKQIKIYPPDNKGKCQIILIYEIKDIRTKMDNGHYLSVDPGLHNLLTCYDSVGKSFILGRKYLEINQKYDKEIARLQHQWGRCQASKGITHPKPSLHLCRVYEKKKNCIHDYLHKVTRTVADYCEENDIHTVIIGDIKNIRRDKNLGKITNQKLHALPYVKIYDMLEYKLAMYGIVLKKQTEEYTSQCPPHAPKVSKRYAVKSNRVNRGLYKEGYQVYNADAVGAYNIMKKYIAISGVENEMSVTGLSSPQIIKVAV
ncbi:MAG: transposase [Clostridia bacterium]|nr:transposase [Clostridia bacterium]